MSLKFDIFEINDLARVVPADMEITTFTGILWWAAALVDGRAAAEPSEPMSLPREPEAVGAGDDAFRLVEPDEPTETVTVVLETAADAGMKAAVTDAAAAAIAAIAASLMFCGVSKSGSPEDRPMTFLPSAFSAASVSLRIFCGSVRVSSSISCSGAAG